MAPTMIIIKLRVASRIETGSFELPFRSTDAALSPTGGLDSSERVQSWPYHWTISTRLQARRASREERGHIEMSVSLD